MDATQQQVLKKKMDDYQKVISAEYVRYMECNEQIRQLMNVNEQRFKSIIEMNQRLGQLFIGDIGHIVPGQQEQQAAADQDAPTGALAAIVAANRATEIPVEEKTVLKEPIPPIGTPKTLLPWEEAPPAEAAVKA